MRVFLIFFIPIVVIDRILKYIIFKNFAVRSSFPLIKGVLHITPTYNKGAAFGLFKEGGLFIIMAISISYIFCLAYILLVKRPKSPFFTSGLLLIFAGACGNLIDRIMYGGVLDFIDIRIWPVFNIADCSITIGVCLVIWHLLRRKAVVSRPPS